MEQKLCIRAYASEESTLTELSSDVKEIQSSAGVPEVHGDHRLRDAGDRHTVGSSQDASSDSSAQVVEVVAFPSGTENRWSSTRTDADRTLVSEFVLEITSPMDREAGRSCSVDEHVDGRATSMSPSQCGSDGAKERVDEQTDRGPPSNARRNLVQRSTEDASSIEQGSDFRELLPSTESVHSNRDPVLPSVDSGNLEMPTAAYKTVETLTLVSQPCSEINTPHRDADGTGRRNGSGDVRNLSNKNDAPCASDSNEEDTNKGPVHLPLPSPLVDSTDSGEAHKSLPQPNGLAADETSPTVEPGASLSPNSLLERSEEDSKSSGSTVERITHTRSPQLKEKLRIFENISRSSRPGSRGFRSLSTSGPCSTRAEGVRRVLSRFRSATTRSRQQPHRHLEAAVLDKEEQIKKLRCVLKHRDETVRELQDTVTKKEEDACYLLNEKLKLCREFLTRIGEQESQSPRPATAPQASNDTAGQHTWITKPAESGSEDRVENSAARPTEDPSLPSLDFITPSRNEASNADESEATVDCSAYGVKAVDGNERLPLKDKLELFETICKHRGYDNGSRGRRGEVNSACPTPSGSLRAPKAANSLFAEKEEELRSLQEEVKKREYLIALLQKAVSAKDMELAEVLQGKYSLSRDFAVYLAGGREKITNLSGATKTYRKYVSSRSGTTQVEADSDCSVRSAFEIPEHCERQHPATLRAEYTDDNGEHTTELRRTTGVSKFTPHTSGAEEEDRRSPNRSGARECTEQSELPLQSPETLSVQRHRNSPRAAQADVDSEANTGNDKQYAHGKHDSIQKCSHLQKSAQCSSSERQEATGVATDPLLISTNKDAADPRESRRNSFQPRNSTYQNSTSAASASEREECRSIEERPDSASLQTLNSIRRDTLSQFNTREEIGAAGRVGVLKGGKDMGTGKPQARTNTVVQQQSRRIPCVVDNPIVDETSPTTAPPGVAKQSVKTLAGCTACVVEKNGEDASIGLAYMKRNTASVPQSSETTAGDALQPSSMDALQKAANECEGSDLSAHPSCASAIVAKQLVAEDHTLPLQQSGSVEGDDLAFTCASSSLLCAEASEETRSIASPRVKSFTEPTPTKSGGLRVPAAASERRKPGSTQSLQTLQLEEVQGHSNACVSPSGEDGYTNESQTSAQKADKQGNEIPCASSRRPLAWKISDSLNGKTVAEVFFEVLLGEMETRIGKMLEKTVDSVLQVPDQLDKTLEAYHETKMMQEEIRRLRLENESLKKLFQENQDQPCRSPKVQLLDKEQEIEAAKPLPERAVPGGGVVARACTQTEGASASPTTQQGYCEKVPSTGAFEIRRAHTSKQERCPPLRSPHPCGSGNTRTGKSLRAGDVDPVIERERPLTTTDSRMSTLDGNPYNDVDPASTEEETIEQLKEKVKWLSEKCSYLEALETMTWKRIQQRLEQDNRARLRLKVHLDSS